MSGYKCIFFDLDHTLWDYEKNSHEALLQLYEHHNLCDKGVTDFDQFFFRFREVNLSLWDLYDRGVIQSDVIRRERFKQILETFNAYEVEVSNQISSDYLHICPQKSHLMPDAIDTLNYLADKYKLTIITNGFEEIQHQKLNSSKVNHFFNHVVTSQKSGHKKPAREIFEYALQANKIVASEAIMIGDNLVTDVGGARNALIDTVFFNPDRIVHQDHIGHEIANLKELCTIL